MLLMVVTLLRLSKKFWLGKIVTVLALVFLTTSCSVALKWQNLKLDDAYVRGQLPNLQNATVGLDPELMYEVDKIMSNFVDTRGEQMGYYTVNFLYAPAITGGGFTLAFFSGFTLFTLNLLGMPIQHAKCTASAYLNIFDSQGNLIESFRKTDEFGFASGFYYGHDVTKKASKTYTKLFKDLLQQTNMKSRSIIDLLNVPGVFTLRVAHFIPEISIHSGSGSGIFVLVTVTVHVAL